jgi:GntR family transcriptional regulator/MocR family aminotransferase
MWLALDGDGPLYRQAYRALRAAILDGTLPSGKRLPSSRVLAREAEIARNTVLQAYEQLVAEGYAESRRGAARSWWRSCAIALRAAGGASHAPRAARAAARSGPPGAPSTSRARHGPAGGRAALDFRTANRPTTTSPCHLGRLLARRAPRASERHLLQRPGRGPSCAKRSRLSRARGGCSPTTCSSCTARSRRSISPLAC